MPATPRTPLWPWALPLAGLFLSLRFAATVISGAGRAFAVERR